MDAGRRTALVTGASSGIGRGFAELLARDGFNVILVARSTERLATVADDLKGRFGAESLVVSIDLARPGASQAVFDAAHGSGAFVEVLVNNAGFATYGAFADLPLDVEREEITVNVLALTELTKLFVVPMLAHGRGRILNVASTAAFQPGPLMAVYYATKAYVLSFSEAISNELEGTGITVTCLAPGATESGFQARAKMQGARLVNRRLPDSMSVARAGYDAMRKGKRLVIPGALNQIVALAPRLSPRGVVLKASRFVQERPHERSTLR